MNSCKVFSKIGFIVGSVYWMKETYNIKSKGNVQRKTEYKVEIIIDKNSSIVKNGIAGGIFGATCGFVWPVTVSIVAYEKIRGLIK